MAYFVHPQIKSNLKNLFGLLLCFLKKPSEKRLEQIGQMFPDKKVYFTDMGRSAFRLIIEELALENSQMIVPAYLCDIFYPIFKKYHIEPIFLDIEKTTFNLELRQLSQKITPRTKAILIPHLYGLANDVVKIKEIISQQPAGAKIVLIEDCAHCFGGKINGKWLGNFGEAAFFSLPKIFPVLRGGLAVLPKPASKIPLETKFSCRDFFSLLNSFPFFAYLFKNYAGKIASKYLKKEKLADIGGLNCFSLNLFLWYAKNFEATLQRRKELALLLRKELEKLGFGLQPAENNSFIFLSALVPAGTNRDQFVLSLRRKGVFATRIWHQPIILNPLAQKDYKINPAAFPSTNEAAQKIVNFPLQNFYTEKDIKRIISLTKICLSAARKN